MFGKIPYNRRNYILFGIKIRGNINGFKVPFEQIISRTTISHINTIFLPAISLAVGNNAVFDFSENADEYNKKNINKTLMLCLAV